MLSDLQATAAETSSAEISSQGAPVLLHLGSMNPAARFVRAPAGSSLTRACGQTAASSRRDSVLAPAGGTAAAITMLPAARTKRGPITGAVAPGEHEPGQTTASSPRAGSHFDADGASDAIPGQPGPLTLCQSDSPPPDPIPGPLSSTPRPKTQEASEAQPAPQPLATDQPQKANARPVPVASAVPPGSGGLRATNHASPTDAAQESGTAAEPAAQGPPPESDVTSASPSPDEIAFGARLVARSAEQPSEPAVTTPGPAFPAERMPSAGASSKALPEAATLPATAGNGTSKAATPAKSERTPGTDEPVPLGQHSEHPEESAMPRAEQPVAPPAAPGRHIEVQEAGFALSPPRAPQTEGPATSASRAEASPVLRSPAAAPPDPPQTGPARDIAVRLSADDKSAVEVRLSERAGEIRVAVHSADPEMAESMRARLPELVDRLGAHGFETEIWRPQQAAAPERGGSGPNPDTQREQPGEQERGHGQQKRDQPRPEWMEELATSFQPPNPDNRSTNG